jgi:hypothetical protein
MSVVRIKGRTESTLFRTARSPSSAKDARVDLAVALGREFLARLFGCKKLRVNFGRCFKRRQHNTCYLVVADDACHFFYQVFRYQNVEPLHRRHHFKLVSSSLYANPRRENTSATSAPGEAGAERVVNFDDAHFHTRFLLRRRVYIGVARKLAARNLQDKLDRALHSVGAQLGR